jgi:hypothetical protein
MPHHLTLYPFICQVVEKSTVPVKTAEAIEKILTKNGHGIEFQVSRRQVLLRIHKIGRKGRPNESLHVAWFIALGA